MSSGSSHCPSSLSLRQNFLNFLLAMAVPLPSILLSLSFFSESEALIEMYSLNGRTLKPYGWLPRGTWGTTWHPPVPLGASTWQLFCLWGLANPVGMVAALFFFNVNVLFWIISLIQGSTWLIDPYWTILPLLISHFYASHPLSVANVFRSRVVLSLVWIWSVRLTHSYFRRERWQWGAREDWRFTDLRNQYSSNWWWISFFLVYVSQEVFLVGICLPLYAIFSSDAPWGPIDTLAACACMAAVLIGYFADTQLYHFVSENHKRKAAKQHVKLVLNEGLWRYSRHPNYFGEQLWWWSLAMFGWILGQKWTLLGAGVNSACMAYVTVLVERRMMEDESRREAYKEYQRSTSVWIPWFHRRKLN